MLNKLNNYKNLIIGADIHATSWLWNPFEKRDTLGKEIAEEITNNDYK